MRIRLAHWLLRRLGYTDISKLAANASQQQANRMRSIHQDVMMGKMQSPNMADLLEQAWVSQNALTKAYGSGEIWRKLPRK